MQQQVSVHTCAAPENRLPPPYTMGGPMAQLLLETDADPLPSIEWRAIPQ